MLDYFQGQAYVTSLYVVFNIMAKCGPIILLCNKFLYFLNAKMAYLWIVIMLVYQLYPDDFQDVKETLVV